MKTRIIVLLCCMSLATMALAQASGGQIRRSTTRQSSDTSKRSSSSNRSIAMISGPDGYVNGHGYVDLGLPSGTKWATCNIGADSPSGWGNYYAWGETQTKSDYSWTTYFDSKDHNGTEFYTYYIGARGSDSISSTSGNDVAKVIWGGAWRMPTEEELKELLSKCNWKYTNLNRVNGYKITGPSGKSIFLPCAGSYSGTKLDHQGSFGTYWSSTLIFNDSAAALNFYWRYNNTGGGCSRCDGCPVRPVTD